MKSKLNSPSFLSMGKAGIAIIAIFLASFFQTNVFAQTAPVNPPTGGFSINGQLRVTSAVGDWFPGTGAGGSVFTENPATARDNTTSGMATDAVNSNDDVFTNGSKFNDYISNLHWFSNSAPDKNDINVALYHVSRDATNNQWIFISGDRLSTNGTSYIDFELLQGSVTKNSDGTFTGTPAAGKANGGGRTVNDIIISMEYTNGGSKPNVYFYQWKLSGSTWSYQPVDLTALPDLLTNAFAETNRTGSITNLPYTAFGSTTYAQYAFVEAGVNITYLLKGILGGVQCAGLNIQTLWVKTKASSSSTAALKDFMRPIPVDFQFGEGSSASAGGPYAICASEASVNVSGTYSGSATGATWSTSGTGGFTNVSTNTTTKTVTATYTPSVVDKTAGSVTLTLTPVGDASCTATPGHATLTINPKPGAPTVTVQNNCDGSSDLTASNFTGTLLWSNNATTASIHVTIPGPYTVTQTSAAGCTSDQGSGIAAPKTTPGAPTVTPLNPCNGASTLTASNYTGTLLWSTGSSNAVINVNDNNTYNVTQTVNGCTSLPGSGHATIKTTPAAPNVSMLSVTCTDKTFSVQVTNPVAGSSYTLTQPGNIDPPSTSQTINYTTGNAIFSGLTFGDGFSVTSTNSDGCVSDPNSCGTVSQNRLAAPVSIQNKPITLEEPVTKVTAIPNPYNNIIRFNLQSDVTGQGRLELYNVLGQKVKTVYQGFIQKGFKQSIDYVVPGVNHSNLIYIFTVGNERKSGILIGGK